MSRRLRRHFNVTLDKAVDAETTLTFKLGGEITAADHGVPTVSIGGQSVTVTANADGTYSFKVPAGTTAASWSRFRPRPTASTKAVRA
jgi:hypothetical protein